MSTSARLLDELAADQSATGAVADAAVERGIDRVRGPRAPSATLARSDRPPCQSLVDLILVLFVVDRLVDRIIIIYVRSDCGFGERLVVHKSD